VHIFVCTVKLDLTFWICPRLGIFREKSRSCLALGSARAGWGATERGLIDSYPSLRAEDNASACVSMKSFRRMLSVSFAASQRRAPLTQNRRDFLRINAAKGVNHCGIVLCTADPDFAGQARRIDEALPVFRED